MIYDSRYLSLVHARKLLDAKCQVERKPATHDFAPKQQVSSGTEVAIPPYAGQILQGLVFDAIHLGSAIYYTRRQNVGKNRTKTLNTSTLPSIISHTNSNFAPWLK